MEPRAKNNNHRRLRRALTRLTALCILVLALLAFWRYSPVGEWSDPDRLGVLLERLHATVWAGPIVVGAFVLGSFVVFPVTALIAATGVALGSWDGLIWASVGTFAGACSNYGIARVIPERHVDAWLGPWTRKMGARFERGGIVSIMIARNIPIAPFTLVNVVAGAAGIRFVDYLIGTVLGMAPTIAALTILGTRLRGVWEAPTVVNAALLCAAIALWFAAALSLQSLTNRWMAANDSEFPVGSLKQRNG